MHIIHIASEMAPLAKVGGLADVVLGLCRELSWKGHDVDIIIPKYDCMDSGVVRDMTVVTADLMSYYEGNWYHNTVWMGWVENLRVYFIDPHHPRYFFNRGCFYGCEDDLERYLYFSRTALEFLLKMQIRPDIIHLHDWQTAVVPLLYRDIYCRLGWCTPKIVFTIHNIEYQGRCTSSDLEKIGLKNAEYSTADALLDPIYPAVLNLLKGAIVYSDFVTTVSPNYAKEIKQSLGGQGLEKTLVKYQDKFSGILNGIDYSFWNPEIDRYLPSHYSSREMPVDRKDHNTLDRKGYIKKLLRERLGLAEFHQPIVACITRLVPQKGLELIKHALSFCLNNGGQFILLGSSPIPEVSAEFLALKHFYTDHPQVHLVLQYQEELSHWVYAGADILIVPSIFEPCGLTQMIALKYGTIPIVRRTGGLADTVFDIDNCGKKFEESNGYTFDEATTTAMDSPLKRAFDCWLHNPEKWRKLVINGMNIDFSWNKSSNLYLDIYKKLRG